MSAELFNEFASSYLGSRRLDLATVPAAGAEYLSSQKEGAEALIAGMRSTHPNLPPIHFDFVDSDEINASGVCDSAVLTQAEGLASAIEMFGDTMGEFDQPSNISRASSPTGQTDGDDDDDGPPILKFRPNGQ